MTHNESKKPFSPLPQTLLEAGFPDFLALNALPQSAPPMAPTFPTWSDLVKENLEEKNKRQAGKNNESSGGEKRLFEALIGNPMYLYLECLEDPSRFDAETIELLQHLSYGMRQLSELTPEELTMLDKATVAYAEPRHRPQHSLSSKLPSVPESMAVQHLTQKELLADDSIELEHREDGSVAPLSTAPEAPSAPPSFWWRS